MYCKKSMNRNPKIQILRALAIIAVVLIHTCNGGYWQVVVRPLINFAVALFIFLSGYLTKIEYDNWTLFYKRRILRVAIPYVIWTIIYTFPSTNIKEYFFYLLTTQSSPILYYIFVYIQLVLLTPLLSKLAKSKWCLIGFVVAPLSIICYKYTSMILGFKPNGYLNILWEVGCLGWFTYYYLGILLGNRLISKKYRFGPLFSLYVFSILLQILETYIWYEYFNEPNCGTQLKLSALLTNTLFLLICYTYINDSNIIISNRMLKLLGDYSFGIYLIHILVIKILSKYWSLYSSLPFVLNSMLILIISCFVVYIGRKLCGDKVSRWIGLC